MSVSFSVLVRTVGFASPACGGGCRAQRARRVGVPPCRESRCGNTLASTLSRKRKRETQRLTHCSHLQGDDRQDGWRCYIWHQRTGGTSGRIREGDGPCAGSWH